jgi:hypothetical protein
MAVIARNEQTFIDCLAVPLSAIIAFDETMHSAKVMRNCEQAIVG